MFTIAFELPGGWPKEKDYATASVLQIHKINNLRFTDSFIQ